MALSLALVAIAVPLAVAGYKVRDYKGTVGTGENRSKLTLTYERLSKRKALVNNGSFTALQATCLDKDGETVIAEIAKFNQPTGIWVVNKPKGIRGKRNFKGVWKGRGVPIQSPDPNARFKAKRAKFAGRFNQRFRRAKGRFVIRWKEVDRKTGETAFECKAKEPWRVKVSG